MITKTCIVCGVTKPLSEFYKNSHCTTDGHEGRCKECRKAYQKEYKETHSEQVRDANRKHVAEKKEHYAEYHKRWREKNYEYKAESDRRWRSNNPERVKDQRRVQNARRRALVVNAQGKYTPKEWRELKSRYGNRCLACGKTEPEVKLTPDHVIPLSLGGSNSIDNIQPLCWSCNAAKQARSTIDYRSNYQSAPITSSSAHHI